jgi:hypothetical protein
MTAAKTTGDERRRAQLEGAAIAAGVAWAAAFSEQLRKEGRRMAGGWPGTLSEARARLYAHLAASMGAGLVLANDEMEALSRATYGAAKNDWLAKAGRDPEP